MEVARGDVDNPVYAALVTLPDVVEERGDEEVVVVVPTVDEPACSPGGVPDVAWMLAAEALEERAGQHVAGQRKVVG